MRALQYGNPFGSNRGLPPLYELLWATHFSFHDVKVTKRHDYQEAIPRECAWIADDTTGTFLGLTTVVRAVFQPDRRARYILVLFNIHFFPQRKRGEFCPETRLSHRKGALEPKLNAER